MRQNDASFDIGKIWVIDVKWSLVQFNSFVHNGQDRTRLVDDAELMVDAGWLRVADN